MWTPERNGRIFTVWLLISTFHVVVGRLIYATRIQALHWFCLFVVRNQVIDIFSDPHWILIVQGIAGTLAY